MFAGSRGFRPQFCYQEVPAVHLQVELQAEEMQVKPLSSSQDSCPPQRCRESPCRSTLSHNNEIAASPNCCRDNNRRSFPNNDSVISQASLLPCLLVENHSLVPTIAQHCLSIFRLVDFSHFANRLAIYTCWCNVQLSRLELTLSLWYSVATIRVHCALPVSSYLLGVVQLLPPQLWCVVTAAPPVFPPVVSAGTGSVQILIW